MADLATYVMRSVGIPVATDFVPQWPYRNGSHTWNAIPDRNGKFLDFLGAEYNPGYQDKPSTKKGKVYRRTYAINPASIAVTKDPDDIVPDFLNDPRITDVTDQYAKCFNPEIPVIDHGHHKYAFLNVFDNVDWKPIGWGKISNEKVIFNKVEGGIAYLPAYYDNGGNIPANYPFILDTIGVAKQLKPAIGHTNKKMTLTRIYPDMPNDIFLGKLDVPDQKYELFYWDDNTWNSMGVQTANGPTVTFNTKISNALFKLQYVPTNPCQQRVFTYENGHQIWW